MGARYPVTRKLLSPQSFDHIAHLYILAEPPRSPVLLEYGESFPQFLRMLGHGHAAEYVADVAELEAARTRAYHAADAAPVSKNAFAGLATDELPDLRIAFHPSISLLKSNFPVVTIWETNLYANDNTIREWNQESALIVRPHLEVQVWRLPAGGFDFLQTIAAGQTVGEAVARATAGTNNFDLAECFKTMISAEIAVALQVGKTAAAPLPPQRARPRRERGA